MLLTVSYEALAANPQQELDNICNYFKMQNFESPGYMELTDDHTIGGTPARFECCPVAEDTTWENLFSRNPVFSAPGKFANSL
jgi:hypothetical protein